MVAKSRSKRGNPRQGAVAVFAACLLIGLCLLAAFAVDVGYLFFCRTQAQRSADAAALAAAWSMADDDRIRGRTWKLHAEARRSAVDYAQWNQVSGNDVVLNNNWLNHPKGDIVIGYLDDPRQWDQDMTFWNLDRYNTVLVRVHCSADRNNAVPLFFGRILGIDSVAISAEAAATFDDGHTVGFRVTKNTGNAKILPFAVHAEDWRNLLDSGSLDAWSYDPETQKLSSRPDGIPEMKIFPGTEETSSNGNGKNKDQGNGSSSITPGNFGTVDVGNSNNSAKDLMRQIREGASADDLAYHGGELRLDPETGTLLLNGDTGLTASIKDALADVVGQPRAVLLYSSAEGQGNNTTYTIVGFAGVRIVDFALTGNDKYIRIQPAVVVDETAIADYGSNTSDFVAPPVRRVR
jgi:hypothetical protein